ncbi:MAG: low molecular weight protein arginine phosphatase [Bacillota bacterium]|nr:low molecular weight protein arginine phosphatase [Bacillota bacterium]
MKVLFVCTGNTCRSCMAEAIFNNNCNIDNIQAFSAGISIVPGSVASVNSAGVVERKLGGDIYKRAAVQLTEEMISEADIILTMTSTIRDILHSYFEKYRGKIFSLNEYVGEEGDIIDPYGSNLTVYEKTYEELSVRLESLLLKLKEDKGIN